MRNASVAHRIPKKRCLFLDRERYRFQKFISDLAGQDIKAHGNQPLEAIRATRDWLRGAAKSGKLPSGAHLAADYSRFTDEVPALCTAAKLSPGHLTFRDYTTSLLTL